MGLVAKDSVTWRLLGDRVISNPLLGSEDDQPAVVRASRKCPHLHPWHQPPVTHNRCISPVRRKARITALKDLLDIDVLNLICVYSTHIKRVLISPRQIRSPSGEPLGKKTVIKQGTIY
jgi:hypothetical protein